MKTKIITKEEFLDILQTLDPNTKIATWVIGRESEMINHAPIQSINKFIKWEQMVPHIWNECTFEKQITESSILLSVTAQENGLSPVVRVFEYNKQK